MNWGVELPLLGGTTFIVTDDLDEYVRLAGQGKRVFLNAELFSIMEQNPTRKDMEWVLIQKKLKPGFWVLDLKARELGYPEGVVPI